MTQHIITSKDSSEWLPISRCGGLGTRWDIFDLIDRYRCENTEWRAKEYEQLKLVWKDRNAPIRTLYYHLWGDRFTELSFIVKLCRMHSTIKIHDFDFFLFYTWQSCAPEPQSLEGRTTIKHLLDLDLADCYSFNDKVEAQIQACLSTTIVGCLVVNNLQEPRRKLCPSHFNMSRPCADWENRILFHKPILISNNYKSFDSSDFHMKWVPSLSVGWTEVAKHMHLSFYC